MKPLPLTIAVFLSLGIMVSFFLNDSSEVKISEGITKELVVSETTEPKLIKVSDDFVQNKDFKNSVKSIAKSFEKQSRFPSTSMPIENEEALQKYIPNQSVGASLPFENDQGEMVRFGIKTSKYRYFHGEEIDIRVFISGEGAAEEAQLDVYLVGNKSILHSMGGQDLRNGFALMSVNTKELNISSWPNEIQVQAVLNLAGDQLQVIETIRLDTSIATIDSVEDSYVDADSLVIPVEIDTDEKGYFRLTGVLYSQTTEKPLVYLEGKSKLSINNDIIKLKAQFQALQVNQDEGPYILKNLWIEKMPSAPDYQSKFGSQDDGEYVIDKHSFEKYSDSDYVNEQAQLSLQFLQKIGGINQSEK